MNDRRKAKRFTEKNRAVIHYSVEENACCRDSNPAWTRNISVDGAWLLAPKSFPLDTKLILSLELPKSEQIVKLWARVVWSRSSRNKGEYEVGVEFIHSLQTRHNLFKHLYGYGIQTKKKKPAGIDNSIPVEITEM
jgi:c-di-GMP-binding flagellar brake protein YcgR